MSKKSDPKDTKGLFQEALRSAEQFRKQFTEAKVRGGFIGLSGSGKSSLINAIVGRRVAVTGSTETTTEPKEYHHGGMILVDLPGCGTKTWPRPSYVKDLDLLKKYDYFVIVTSNRLYEDDIYLYNELHIKHRKPCFIVRTKIDLAIKDELQDNNLTEDQTLEKCRGDVIKDLSPKPARTYMASCRHPAMWDLPRLIDDIRNSLDGINRDRFTADTAAYSESLLKAKREVAMKSVLWHALSSAGNAFNPIPGVDVAVDLGILAKLVAEIQEMYGLTSDQLAFTERMIPEARLAAIKQTASKFVARYLSREAIILVLKRCATRETLKETVKWLPIVGQLIAAGIGYKMTINFGEEVVNTAEGTALEILKAIMMAPPEQ